MISAETSMNPVISFITVTFNAGKTLSDTINSVAREAEGVFYEHLIVDGDSTDDTLEIASRLLGPHAKIVSEPDNGVYDAMNKGISRARGDWIAIINADDYYEPGAISKIMAAASRDPAVQIVHGDMNVLYEDASYVVKAAPGWSGRLGRVHPISHPAMWARRGVYERLGGYNTTYRLAADQEFFFRVLDAHERCLYIPEVITCMRAGGLSGRYYDEGTIELLNIHARRSGLVGILGHLLFYRQFRLRNHAAVQAGKPYWLWALNDFTARRRDGARARPIDEVGAGKIYGDSLF
jgi:glycosyltransferase involved in cell wall biosynthesis